MESFVENNNGTLLLTWTYFNDTVLLTHQSQEFDVSEWISLLTLCFAPLIAHIIAGVPSRTHLSHSKPRWHDLLPLYNPITIIWRYLVIADRRLRAKSWDLADLAAANAYFWTSDGWNGSEEIAIRSRHLLTRPPEKTGLQSLLSSSFVSTIVTALQGVQAIYLLAASISGSSITNAALTMANLFTYVAVMGCVRVLAAVWITDDFAYAYDDPTQKDEYGMIPPGDPLQDPSKQMQPWQIVSSDDETTDGGPRYESLGWKSYLLRSTVLLFVTALFACTVYDTFIDPALIARLPSYIIATSTGVLGDLLYFFLIAPAFFIIATYAFQRNDKALRTILPCVSAWWYKTFTFLWYCFAIVLVVISGLETGKDKCGDYTTFPVQVYSCNQKGV